MWHQHDAVKIMASPVITLKPKNIMSQFNTGPIDALMHFADISMDEQYQPSLPFIGVSTWSLKMKSCKKKWWNYVFLQFLCVELWRVLYYNWLMQHYVYVSLGVELRGVIVHPVFPPQKLSKEPSNIFWNLTCIKMYWNLNLTQSSIKTWQHQFHQQLALDSIHYI